MLAAQWRSMQLQLWLQDAEGTGWHVLIIYGSLLQGGLDGHPVFCVVIAVVLVTIAGDGRVAHFWKQVYLWVYVDDLLFQCPVPHTATLLQVVEDALQLFQLRPQRQKSKLHIPALASASVINGLPKCSTCGT